MKRFYIFHGEGRFTKIYVDSGKSDVGESVKFLSLAVNRAKLYLFNIAEVSPIPR